MLRNYKIFYQLYNFFYKSKLQHNLAHYKRFGIAKSYFSSVSSEDFKNIKSPVNLYDAKDSFIEMPKDPNFNSLGENVKSALLPWSKNGYVILDQFFNSAEIEAFNTEVENLISTKKAKFKNDKIMFAIHDSKLLTSAGNHTKVHTILEVLLGKRVELFQSINFLKGSQQRTHSDSIHMTTFPYGNMIAIWIALEDINADCGPLHYYPGSHKLPFVFNRHFGNVGSKHKLGDQTYGAYEDCIETLVKKHSLKKKVFLAKKGDLLIWHSNLLHGGEKVNKPNSTRKSMVFHYYTNDAICFHEITQRPSLKMNLI